MAGSVAAALLSAGQSGLRGVLAAAAAVARASVGISVRDFLGVHVRWLYQLAVFRGGQPVAQAGTAATNLVRGEHRLVSPDARDAIRDRLQSIRQSSAEERAAIARGSANAGRPRRPTVRWCASWIAACAAPSGEMPHCFRRSVPHRVRRSVAGHALCAQTLIGYGAEPNSSRENGWTALMAACQAGHMQCCELLIDNRALVGRGRQDTARREADH